MIPTPITTLYLGTKIHPSLPSSHTYTKDFIPFTQGVEAMSTYYQHYHRPSEVNKLLN